MNQVMPLQRNPKEWIAPFKVPPLKGSQHFQQKGPGFELILAVPALLKLSRCSFWAHGVALRATA